MATFVCLLNFTDQGIRNVKDSPDRYEAFKALAATMDVQVRDILWTVGAYDIVAVLDGPEDAAATLLLKLGSLGNLRSQTLRAYSAQEMRGFIAKMP